MRSGSLLILFAAALLLQEGLFVLLNYAGCEVIGLWHSWRGHIKQVFFF